MSRARRTVTGLLSLAVLLAFPVAFLAAPSSPSVRSALRRLGAPPSWAVRPRLHGLLLTFLSDLSAGRISTPPGYGAEAVAATLKRYSGSGAQSVTASQRVNLIVYLVESFMDPDDLGLRFTSDPIPNIRALRRTHGVSYGFVPEQFGGSANTEFEVLTGMTMAMLPTGSVPYQTIPVASDPACSLQFRNDVPGAPAPRSPRSRRRESGTEADAACLAILHGATTVSVTDGRVSRNVENSASRESSPSWLLCCYMHGWRFPASGTMMTFSIWRSSSAPTH